MSIVSAVIVAAGKGTRMGPNMDKLFLEVCGRPIIAHTWARFHACVEIDEIILVIRDGLQADFDKLATTYRFRKTFRYATGGAERQHSVWNGLMQVSPECEIVAIQDGARPCTTEEMISDCIAAARKTGGAVAAQRVTDTLKEVGENGLVTRHLDRSRIWSVQTPQVFKTEVIRRALGEVMKQGLTVTDDTAACGVIEQPIQVVESMTPNPKATSPADIPYIEMVLNQQLAKGPRTT